MINQMQQHTYTLIPGESSVQNFHIPPEDCGALALVAPAVVDVTFLCLTVEPDDLDGIERGDLLLEPTDVELGAEAACWI